MNRRLAALLIVSSGAVMLQQQLLLQRPPRLSAFDLVENLCVLGESPFGRKTGQTGCNDKEDVCLHESRRRLVNAYAFRCH